MVQYALGVKKEEMRKLEDIAQTEEKRLLEDEKTLEEDAAKFDAFLKENDKNSVEAIIKWVVVSQFVVVVVEVVASF